MGKYAVHRVDANAGALYKFLEAHGIAIQKTPGGPLDAIVAVDGPQAIVEVKDGRKKLRALKDGRKHLRGGQADFLRDWPGLTAVLRTEADCLVLIQKLRQMAGWERTNTDG